MILNRVISYLKLNHRIAIRDMACALNISPDALRELLALLERKEKVRRLPSQTKCSGGCSKCAPEAIELYEWIST